MPTPADGLTPTDVSRAWSPGDPNGTALLDYHRHHGVRRAAAPLLKDGARTRFPGTPGRQTGPHHQGAKMNRRTAKPHVKERRWVVFNNGCIHGIQRSEMVMIRTIPKQSIVHDTVAVFTLTKTFSAILTLGFITALVLLLAGCQMAAPQRGGSATAVISRPGHTNVVTLTQSQNPKEPSRQTVQSEQTIEYVIPPGTAFSVGLEDRSSKLEDRVPAGVRKPANSDLLSP